MSATNKSVLVIDTPESCRTCKFRYDNYGCCEMCILIDDEVDYFYISKTRPEWCPLSPLPPHKDISQYVQRGDAKSMTHMMASIYASGYNECLDEIKKGDNK